MKGTVGIGCIVIGVVLVANSIIDIIERQGVIATQKVPAPSRPQPDPMRKVAYKNG